MTCVSLRGLQLPQSYSHLSTSLMPVELLKGTRPGSPGRDCRALQPVQKVGQLLRGPLTTYPFLPLYLFHIVLLNIDLVIKMLIEVWNYSYPFQWSSLPPYFLYTFLFCQWW